MSEHNQENHFSVQPKIIYRFEIGGKEFRELLDLLERLAHGMDKKDKRRIAEMREKMLIQAIKFQQIEEHMKAMKDKHEKENMEGKK